ncbi:MAG: DNA polymerase III subunit delta [Muribaculaceae bacterium]|nr:DNA polymerase III subunit delta [Muribaculaceae bacterium]
MRDEDKIPHALLFNGPSGIGKMMTARAFAQYIHCQKPVNGDSCGKCPSCLQHNKFNNPDLHFIFPVVKKDGVVVSKDLIDQWKIFLDKHSFMPVEKWSELINAGNSQTNIYVNECENILSVAALSTYQEKKKIFILWLPEKLRQEAANKLLKVIEEPFEDTVFILVSNDASRILPTILSRTRRVNFSPLQENEIAIMLQSKGVSHKLSSDFAKISAGSLAKAEQYAFHPDEINEFSELFKNIMRAAYALKAKQLKSLSDEVASFGREKIIRFLNYCNRLIRENFIYNMNVDALVAETEDERQFSSRFAPFIHEGNVEKLEAEIARAATDIERNANSKIVLFDLFLILSRLVRKPKESFLPFIMEPDLI